MLQPTVIATAYELSDLEFSEEPGVSNSDAAPVRISRTRRREARERQRARPAS